MTKLNRSDVSPREREPEQYKVQFNSTRHTLRIEAFGTLSRNGILEFAVARYPSFHPTSILWDLRQASISSLSTEDLQAIAELTRPLIPASLRRTAYLVLDVPSYAKMMHYLNQTVRARVRVEYNVFREEDKALAWLNGAR